ncbi:MAG: hypothetical protein Kow0032_07870 [Methyloligellaceae bacterium]
MLSEIPYGTFANYSPRGTSELSQKSRNICGHIKAGKVELIQSALPYLQSPDAAALAAFLNPKVTFVPVPRSAPLAEGALWPSRVIADILAGAGLGGSVLPCVERLTAVRKSSSSPAKERPSVAEHYESLGVEDQLIKPAEITLVDDVLTQGRTMIACALRLQEAFPDAVIRGFAMIRTQGFVDNLERIVDPSIGVIRYYENSGKTFRDP